jgi:hypothetical protein
VCRIARSRKSRGSPQIVRQVERRVKSTRRRATVCISWRTLATLARQSSLDGLASDLVLTNKGLKEAGRSTSQTRDIGRLNSGIRAIRHQFVLADPSVSHRNEHRSLPFPSCARSCRPPSQRPRKLIELAAASRRRPGRSLIRTILLERLGDHDRALVGGFFSQRPRGADFKSVYEMPTAKARARVQLDQEPHRSP